MLSPEDKKFVQQVLGTFLYYARAVNSTMLVALSAIAAEQSAPMDTTMAHVDQFLDYAVSQEPAVLTYHASAMVFACQSDASYLTKAKSHSRAGGHFFCSNNNEYPQNNGAVLTIAQIIRAVVSSAVEAEVGAMLINSQEAIPARKTLEEVGYPQPPTPMQMDNSAAHAVVTKTVAPRRLKAMNMRFWWLQDRETQGRFRFYWRPGNFNLGDYFTKHHADVHHANMRKEFITLARHIEDLRRRQGKLRIEREMARVVSHAPAAQ